MPWSIGIPESDRRLHTNLIAADKSIYFNFPSYFIDSLSLSGIPSSLEDILCPCDRAPGKCLFSVNTRYQDKSQSTSSSGELCRFPVSERCGLQWRGLTARKKNGT